MPRPYPLDLRERLLAARAAGLPVAEIEAKFHVSRRTLNRWQQRQADEAVGLAPTPLPGRPPKLAPTDAPALIALVQADPDATLATYCDQWATQQGVRVSPATMCRHLRRLDLTLKKNAGCPRAGSDRAGPMARRDGRPGPAAARLRR